MGFTNLISKLFFPKNGTATRNSAKAIPTEGRCGEQIEWKFIPGERELRISGTGATYEFVRTKDVPWEAFVSQIQKISVEEGVTSLGSRLFRYCNILKEVSLPHSLRQIGQHCFAYCSNLASIHLPEGLSSIDKYAFSHCTSLQELALPASLAQIRQSAFAHCSNLNNIHFLSETTEIGSSCFSGCTSLAGIRLPERLERINKNLFQNCASLTRIHIPQSVTTVEDEAFKDCHRLETIDLPATVHNIGKQVFSGCHSLTSLTLPFPGWGTPALAHQFCELFGTSPDKEMRLVTPNQGETTQNYYLPISLSVLHIAEGCETIPAKSLCECYMLKKLHLPASLYLIGDYAFSNCAGLTAIYCHGKEPASVPENAFNGVRRNVCRLFVPAGCRDIYNKDKNWSIFTQIEEMP